MKYAIDRGGPKPILAALVLRVVATPIAAATASQVYAIIVPS